MPSQRRSYNPNAVFLTIGGKRIENGVADGFVTISWNAPMITASRDLSGETTHIFGTDRSAKASVKVPGSSPAYEILGAIVRSFRDAGDEGSAFPALSFRLTNRLSGELIMESEAVPMDLPEMSLGAEVGDREFTFDLPNARGKVQFAPSAV